MMVNGKYYQNELNNKIYIYKTGWEYVEKPHLQLSREALEKDFVTFYPNWDIYAKQMRVRIWDFVVRYCMKLFRLSEKEMRDFDEYILKVVQPNTSFHNLRGKVTVWAVASLYFFAQLKLRKREAFEITLDRISEIFDLSCG